MDAGRVKVQHSSWPTHATYSIDDGWRCDDAMLERFLRTNCTPELAEDTADAVAQATAQFAGLLVAEDGGNVNAATSDTNTSIAAVQDED